MSESKTCPTTGCDTTVECVEDGQKQTWDCPNCAWILEIELEEDI